MRRTSTHRANGESSWRGIWKGFAILAVLSLALSQAAAEDHPENLDLPADSISTSPKRELVISIPDRKLAVIEDGEVIKIYPVAVGKPSTPSPTGRFEIVNRIENPTYYHKGVVIGPGRANPLGNRWLGLSLKGYGIHGTNEQNSIGHAASHGCIRMAKRDVEELFSYVSVGDVVEIHRIRDAELAEVFQSEAEAKTAPVARQKTVSPVVVAAAMADQL
jgi:L,D-transpeptidase catalytic domain